MLAREKPFTLMRPEQVHLFAKRYYNYMDNVHGEIAEDTQRTIRSMIDLLAEDVGLCIKPTLNCMSIPNKINLGFNKKIEGPLTGKEKLEFLMSVQWNIKEILTLNTVNDYDRRFKAGLICLASKIQAEVYHEWTMH